MYILCLIELWTRSPKTEVENVFLNVLAGFLNLGKLEKNRGNSYRFSEKSKCLKKKEKKRKRKIFTIHLCNNVIKIC